MDNLLLDPIAISIAYCQGILLVLFAFEMGIFL